MNKHITRTLATLTALSLSAGFALADSISFEGTVGAKTTREIYAPIGGTIETVDVEVGRQVAKGDVLATLSTTKVYAEEDGTVTGLFAQPGDNAETIAARYGAVMYIEGEGRYTISASTTNAYNSTATKTVHTGEDVYLSCYSDGNHTGTGIITAIEGTDYTVEVESGDFIVGETVNVYRGEKATSTLRVGRGTLTRKNPTAVSGTGSIVAFAVKDGDAVKRGDLLFETLEGSFDGLYMSGRDILADGEGTIATLNLTQGGKLEKNSVAAVLYPAEAMRIEAHVNETDLASIAVGTKVDIELLWNQDFEVSYPGVVTMISRIADEAAQSGSEETASSTTYTVYIDFTPDANTRFGMSAVISTVDEAEFEDMEETWEEEEF